MSRKLIYLHGHLAGLFLGPPPGFEAESAAEAIYALTRQTKVFNPRPYQPSIASAF